MEEKISRKYLKASGWKISQEENHKDVGNHMGEHVYEKHEMFKIELGSSSRPGHHKRSWARIDRYYRKTTNKFKDCKTSNYYMVYAYGNGFHIETGVIHRKLFVSELESIIKLIRQK